MESNIGMLDAMLLDKQAFTLTVVGRKHMTAYELWQAWLVYRGDSGEV